MNEHKSEIMILGGGLVIGYAAGRIKTYMKLRQALNKAQREAEVTTLVIEFQEYLVDALNSNHQDPALVAEDLKTKQNFITTIIDSWL